MATHSKSDALGERGRGHYLKSTAPDNVDEGARSSG
jgi:hypothetical protein